MPMPAANTPWPPPAHADAYRDFEAWDAWYSGDPDRLFDVYSPDHGTSRRDIERRGYNTRAQHTDGVIGQLARWFMGAPPRAGERVTRLHIPAAGDLATTWADLMFGQAPTVTAEDPDTKARLDELFDEDVWAQLHEAATLQGALGGVYVTVGFDRQAAPSRPLLFVNHADNAVPRFAGRRLAEVTFHTEIGVRDGRVWRHLEHHAPGRVEHGLFMGTDDNLGARRPLPEAPELEHIVELLSEDGVSVPTGLDRLDTVYVKLRPTKRWRRQAALRRLGSSLYDGVEGSMDALNETYSSWMRDVRLAKARLIVPSSFLDNLGPGEGARFDADREVFTTVNSMAKDAMSITPSQFAIRFTEHHGTAQELWERVVSGAGFSAQTFGLRGEAAMTAAESWARERKTHYTRGGGIRGWTLGIREIAELLLLVDRAEFGSSVPIDEAQVEFPPLVADQPRDRAETGLAMRHAKAASTYTLVKMQHPEWEESQVRRETLMIEKMDAAELDTLLDDPLDELDEAIAALTGRNSTPDDEGEGEPAPPPVRRGVSGAVAR